MAAAAAGCLFTVSDNNNDATVARGIRDGCFPHGHSTRSASPRCWMPTRVIIVLVAVLFLVASPSRGAAATHILGENYFAGESMEKQPAETRLEQVEGWRLHPQGQQQQQQQERRWQGQGPLVAAPRELSAFPSVTNSTILFLHVFKCAGTSLREVLTTWAKRAGWSGLVVAYCRFKGLSSPGRICLNSENDLVDPMRQKWMVKGSKLLAGHFLWDFRHYVTPPYLMITTLRNPLELFVSSQQYMHRDKTETLADSVAYVSGSMRDRLGWDNPRDLAFIRRFLDAETAEGYNPRFNYAEEEIMDMARSAVEHLNTFYIVGVVEQYEGFIEVLKRSLDPGIDHPRLWKKAVDVKENGSPVHSGDVLRYIDYDLVTEFNATSLSLQWQVYEVALQLWDNRCREILPRKDHAALCTVPIRW